MLKKAKFPKYIILAIAVAGILVAGFFVYKRAFSKEAVLDQNKAELPIAKTVKPISATVSSSPTTTAETKIVQEAPAELNLEVPFTSQAPMANWDRTHEEACEEAAVLMANRFFRGESISGSEDAERGLQDIIDWENKNLGFFESTTAQETTRVIEEMLGLKTEIVFNPKSEDIKNAIANNKLVIVPSAGRELGNPFYKAPGPLYHMLLIKGYTVDKFITNDAGTKRGENYPYEVETVLSANHDWNGGDVESGKRVIIIVSK